MSRGDTFDSRDRGASARRPRHILLSALWIVMLTCAPVLLPALGLARAAAAGEPAELSWMGRSIYTLRASVAGATPEQRAKRALERLRAVPAQRRLEPVRVEETLRDRERVLALVQGETTLLTVFARDLDPDTGATLDEVAARSRDEMALALRARAEMDRPEVVLRGVAWAVVGVFVLAVTAWGATRLRIGLNRRLRRLVERGAATHRVMGVDWTELGLRAVTALSSFASLLVGALMAYALLAHVLRQFPGTEPLAGRLREGLINLVIVGARAGWAAAPDLALVVLVVLVARSVVWGINLVFGGVIAARFSVPGIHPETARATRRLAVFSVWGLALAAAYPLIPGSQSDVFRGLSVFLGFMFTLGSTGVVSQWMHGLVIVYSRALRVGDFVRIGGIEGVVKELGTLSVKLVDHRQDEVTVPNSSVVAGPVTNLSRLAPDGGVHGAITLTIGYDVPWRRVHDLMLEAAARTTQVRRTPPPVVLQRDLADHSVAYELMVSFDHASQRSRAMSALHGHVRDVFDDAGVAIQSPLIVLQAAAESQAAPTPR